jgi:Type II secretion system (T2SS), protein M subtype b
MIGVRLDLAGPLKAVHGVIFAIEDSKPYFFVNEASLRLSREIQRPNDLKTEPVIEARLDVFGAYKAEETP